MRISHVAKMYTENDVDVLSVELCEVTPSRDGVEYKDAQGSIELIIDYNDECGILTMEFENWSFDIGTDADNKEFKMTLKDLEKMRSKIFDKVGQDIGCHV